MNGQTKRWWLWLPLLAIGGWLAAFGDKSPASEAAVSVPVRAASPVRASSQASEPLIAVVPRDILIAKVEDPKEGAAPRDLFSTRSWNPPPPPPATPTQAAPVAPPIPFTFVGKKLEGSAWEVFLVRGEQTFVARQGRMVDSNYRVDKVLPPTLTLTYMPLDQVQTIGIGDVQ